MSLVVVNPGPSAIMQDLGRYGHLTSGVGISGAFDRRALSFANRLVGNSESFAAIEILGGGFECETNGATVIAITGARGEVFVNDVVVSRNVPIVLRHSDRVRVATPAKGIRSYLAVSGGVDVPYVLGSASWDTLARLGPAPLVAGQVLTTGQAHPHVPGIDIGVERRLSTTLIVTPGPHPSFFVDDALASLVQHEYVVSAHSDRIGVRFTGAALARVTGMELPSAPMVRGAIQVPPDGQPLMLGPDHPVTGGYPVVAVVTEHSVDDAAQFTPGLHVRFQLA